MQLFIKNNWNFNTPFSTRREKCFSRDWSRDSQKEEKRDWALKPLILCTTIDLQRLLRGHGEVGVILPHRKGLVLEGRAVAAPCQQGEIRLAELSVVLNRLSASQQSTRRCSSQRNAGDAEGCRGRQMGAEGQDGSRGNRWIDLS